MSYMHINNLYKSQEILMFKECYALEKIHGTSAHIKYKNGALTFFSGGVSHENFVALFDADNLTQNFKELGAEEAIIYGEAYGGKCQGMSKTYGSNLKFVCFEVKINDCWLSVPIAESIVKKFGLEFVHYNRIPAETEAIDAERDSASVQAYRNGITEPMIREGVVLRPLVELTLNNGDRIIAKHKRAEFAERKSTPNLDPAQREILEGAEAIAMEWVTETRLDHVLDAIGNPADISDTGNVIKAMVEDVCREASGEIVESKAARKAIGARAAKLFKSRIINSVGRS